MQLSLLRDIFGNPFHKPTAIDPDWRTFNDTTISKLAQAIYDERRFEDMPLLADALMDAGCHGEQFLNHCRQLGVHVRGCWALDLILGKE